MGEIKFVHKLLLGTIVGMILFGLCFALAYGIITAVNGIAGTEAFDPFFFPLLIGFMAFMVPIAGIISMDFDERLAR